MTGTTEIRGWMVETSGVLVSESTGLRLQTMGSLNVGDTGKLGGNCRAADGYFSADRIAF